jgi:hypothetical protein
MADFNTFIATVASSGGEIRHVQIPSLTCVLRTSVRLSLLPDVRSNVTKKGDSERQDVTIQKAGILTATATKPSSLCKQHEGTWRGVESQLLSFLTSVLEGEVARESAVGIATRYGLDGPGIESQWRRDFPRPSRPALGQPSLLYEGKRVFLGGKAAGGWR